jgi:pilus assembly protein CpaC
VLNKYANATLLAAISIATHSAHAATNPSPALKPCSSVMVEPPTQVTLGKSTVVKLGIPAARMVVGGLSTSRAGKPAEAEDKEGKNNAIRTQTAADGIADVDISLLSPTELFFVGKRSGSMNVVLQSSDGRCSVKDIIVTIDPTTLQAKLAELMPEESGIKVSGAENAIVLTGKVSDATKLDEVLALAGSYGDGKKVVNMLRVSTPQQVMLEVKIAEVSKTLLDKFGLDFARLTTSADGMTSRIMSGILGGGPATLAEYTDNPIAGYVSGRAGAAIGGGTAAAQGFLGHPELGFPTRNATLLGVDAQKKDGLVRVLAEPNIMAISGQAASFLSGGKIFIPIAQDNNGRGTTITLEEKEFGVGLKFTPTVLDGTRVNLKLVSEVSELSQTGSPFTTFNGFTAVLPSMATRKVDTTVQLNDGQSFAIAGLIKNNITETLSRFPGLGEIPVLGALFRSTEFQNDQTELMFVITPRLVKPAAGKITLPTDNHVAPTRTDALFMGRAEGTAKDAAKDGSMDANNDAARRAPATGTDNK